MAFKETCLKRVRKLCAFHLQLCRNVLFTKCRFTEIYEIAAATTTTTTHPAAAAPLYYNTRNVLPCPLALLKHHITYNCTTYATRSIAFIHCSD